MLNFFYDSLDTFMTLKFPTRTQFTNMTLTVLFVIILGGFLIAGMDGIASSVISTVHGIFTGK